jgi:hypothetical protein
MPQALQIQIIVCVDRIFIAQTKQNEIIEQPTRNPAVYNSALSLIFMTNSFQK